MILVEFFALFLCGTFFGAAVYISIAQHPATMKAGIPVGEKFFPLMYKLAVPMQIASALGGHVGGPCSVVHWWRIFLVGRSDIACNHNPLHGDCPKTDQRQITGYQNTTYLNRDRTFT